MTEIFRKVKAVHLVDDQGHVLCTQEVTADSFVLLKDGDVLHVEFDVTVSGPSEGVGE